LSMMTATKRFKTRKAHMMKKLNRTPSCVATKYEDNTKQKVRKTLQNMIGNRIENV
jgi:hypothetical protein